MMKTLTAFLGGLCLLLSGLFAAAQAQSCPAPSITSITRPAPGTLAVNFTPVATATGYVVHYFWTGDSLNPSAVHRQLTSSSPATLSGLLPSAYYVVSVGSICSPGDTVYSPTLLGYTTSPNTPTCATVTTLQVSSVTSNSAQVSFSGSGSALLYSIRYAVAGTSLYQVVNTSNPAATLSGLQPNTTYLVQVSANCSGGTSSAWVGTTFTTLSATPPAPCGSVTNIVVTATSDSTALVSFTPGANNTSFIITYHQGNDSVRWVRTNSSPAIIAGLIPGHTYNITVTGICGSSGSYTYSGSSATTFGFRGTTALSARGRLGTGQLLLYPNPARQAVQLAVPAVPGATVARVTLLNALGQEVRTQQVTLSGAGTPARLELMGLKAGLYTVRVAAGGQSASQRLVVEP